MPYSMEKPEDLSGNVQKLSKDRQEVWINVFNSAFKLCQEHEPDLDKCEATAFAQANGTIKDSKAETLDPEDTPSVGKADYSGSAMVAFYLPAEIASQLVLGIPGAIPADDLHLTLAYLGKAEDIEEDQVEKIKRCVGLWAKSQIPIDVRINGLARFTKTGDDGMQPLVALLDSHSLKSLQYSLESYIRYDGGYDYKMEHEFMPHVTLGYLPKGALWPIQTLPELKFALKEVAFKVGDTRYELELTGEMTEGSVMSNIPMSVLKAGARNSKVDKASVQTIHDKASHLGANCMKMDENKALQLMLEHYELPLNEKAYDLERQAYQVRQAWYAMYDPPKPDNYYNEMAPMKYWVKTVLDDCVIVEHYESGAYYKYEYTIEEGAVTFSDPVQVEMEYIPVGKTAPEKVTIKTYWTCAVEGHEHEDETAAQKCIAATSLNTSHVRGQFVKSAYGNNALKTVDKTAEELTVANYMILFGGRDLEGVASPRINADGTKGEFFTKGTMVDSDYTATGQLLIDWEHRSTPDVDGPDEEDIFGYVDWKSVVIDETGIFVNRVLNRRNKYVQMLESLFDAGIIGSSSEPVQKGVIKGVDGEIKEWPLKRDSFSVSPMDPRMLSVNHLQLVKALRDDPDGHEVYQAVFHNEVAAAEAAAVSLISQIGATKNGSA